MKASIAVSLTLILCVFTLQAQPPTAKKAGGTGTDQAMEKFKKLAGEWTGKGMIHGQSQDLRVIYKVTSGGSTVVETFDPGTDHEMMTVIHANGDELAFTHYCVLGNQPHMKSKPKAGDNQVAFEFVNASNLASDKDAYMRSVTYTFVDNDTLKAEWTHYMDGKDAGKVLIEMTRKK